jgi:hypothetical protein
VENWKLFLDEHLKTISYDDIVNVTGQGIFAVIHYLQAYDVWLETKVEKFTSTNNTRDKILLCADKVFACKSYVSVCKANLGWCTSQRKTSPIA